MSLPNHKRTTSSLVPPIICVAKKISNKNIEGSPLKSESKQLFDEFLNQIIPSLFLNRLKLAKVFYFQKFEPKPKLIALKAMIEIR